MYGEEFHSFHPSLLWVTWWPHGTSGPGLSPGQGHCVVFLGKKTLYSQGASLFFPPRCINDYQRIYCWRVTLRWTSIPSWGIKNSYSRFTLLKPGKAPSWWATWLVCRLSLHTSVTPRFWRWSWNYSSTKIFLLLAKYAYRLFFAVLKQARNIWPEKQSTLERFSHEERSAVTDMGLEKEEQNVKVKNIWQNGAFQAG